MSATVKLNRCDGCAGAHQKEYEPCFYSGVHAAWFCAHCREVNGMATATRFELAKDGVKRTIATSEPARVDEDGNVWFRPAFKGKAAPKLWGWTASPEQAHPDYAAELIDDVLFWRDAEGNQVHAKAVLDARAAETEPDKASVCAWCETTHDGGPENCPSVKNQMCLVCAQEVDPDTHECPGHADQKLRPTEEDYAGMATSYAETPPQPDEVIEVKQAPNPPLEGEHMDPDLEHAADRTLLEHGKTPAQPKEPDVEITPEGEVDPYRRSEFMGYPMPPFPEQVNVDLDRWQRYKVPSLETGKLTSYPRATTIAKVIDDGYNLERWKQRQKVTAAIKGKECFDLVTAADEAGTDVSADPDMDAWIRKMAEVYGQYEEALESGTSRDINKYIDLLDDWNGGAEARELGSFVHDWLSELDMGKILIHQMPEMMQPYAIAYQKALADAGLVPVPIYCERLVINDQGDETVCGRLDRIFQVVETGELVLGDLKTGEANLDFVLVEWPIQFAVYGYSTFMLSYDRKVWDPMPKLIGIPHESDAEVYATDDPETDGIDPRDPYCVVVSLPRNDPSKTQVLPIYLEPGAMGMMQAFEVRDLRKKLPKTTMGGKLPKASKKSLRWVQARQALQAMTSTEDAVQATIDFADVWDDALDEFGAECFELLPPTADAPADAETEA